MLSLILVSIIWGAWLQFVAVANQGTCSRHVQFTPEIDGYALEGHVIQNLTLPMDSVYNPCRGQCVMDDRCVSINIGPPINDQVVCELSESDRSLHPEDLKPREGFTYTGTENACSSNPCFQNATCLNGFTDKRYICVCQTGYTGENCEIGCLKDESLGMESGKIINPQITASSQYSAMHAAFRARLNKRVEGDMKGGWSVAKNDTLQWIQVDFGDKATVKRVATQGRDEYSQWVTKYKLQYSDDGQTFHTYNKEFTGNSDQNTIVYNKLDPPIKARYVRLQPTAWKYHISMRMEFYGCKDCAEALSDAPCKVLSTDCNLAGNLRTNCGYGGITKAQCETRGCCFNNNIRDVHWCFLGGLKVT